MSTIIGKVRLARGNVGYFDDLTRIYLTLASPEKPVFSGMNTKNLKHAVKTGTLQLVWGTLDATDSVVKEKFAPIVPKQVETVVEPIVEQVVVEQPVETELPAVEDIIEDETIPEELTDSEEEGIIEITKPKKGKKKKK